MGESPPVGSSGLAHSPQGGEQNLHSRGHARTTVGDARPSTQAAHRRAASRAHVLPAVIPATKRSYAEVAASRTSPLDSVDWVYVQQGGSGPPLADNYQGPFCVLKRGQKTFKLQMGECMDHVWRDRLKPHREVKNLKRVATWQPIAGWRLVPRLVLMTNVPTGLPVTCLQ